MLPASANAIARNQADFARKAARKTETENTKKGRAGKPALLLCELKNFVCLVYFVVKIESLVI
jgi:hypothetical protein